jgi:4-carboxymuconolactone decarboxylase
MSDELHDAGMEVRRAVLGDDHVDRAVAGTTDFTRPFQELITKTAWGSVWTRDDELGRRERSMITLAVLTTLRATDELAMHVRAALRNGLTPEEIREVILHTAIYAGVPQANTALALAQKVLQDEGAIPR